MKSILKTSLLTAMLATSSVAVAEDKEPDPSDLTQTSTSAYFQMSSQGGLKGSVSRDFQFESSTGMLTIEAAMDKEGDYSDSRMQYFQVFGTGNATAPRAAVSLDMIDNQMFTSAALGGVAMIHTPLEDLNLFPRLGALAGEYKDDVKSAFNLADTSGVGYSAAMYIYYTMGKDGSYVGLFPEYNYMSGDADLSTLKTTLEFGTPLSQDKSRWGILRIENNSGYIKNDRQSYDLDGTTVWARYKFYF